MLDGQQEPRRTHRGVESYLQQPWTHFGKGRSSNDVTLNSKNVPKKRNILSIQFKIEMGTFYLLAAYFYATQNYIGVEM